MHSLMFGWEYPPLHLGGLGVACQGIVRGLLHHGVKVTLVLPNPDAEPDDNLDVVYPSDTQLSNVKVHSMLTPYDSAEEYAVRVKGLPREMNQIYGKDLHKAIHNYTESSVEMTKNTNPDVLHAHDWMTYEAGLRSARHHNKPLVAHIHSTELDRTYFKPHQWIYDQERKGLESADKIIAVSNYTKNIVVKHYGISEDKIAVVHNANTQHKEPVIITPIEKHHPMVLFLGRLTIQKGPWQFLDMAAQIHKMRPDVQFVIAGDGHMLEELIERTYNLGLADCVIFTGKVSGEEVNKLYRLANCFVMPSTSEPFGLVALEAIAQGTPVIISKQAGVSEVVGHSFKVDFWDTAMMSDCVLTILREQPLAHQMRLEAPRVLDRLTWQNQAGIVKSIYEDSIQT